VKAGLLLVVVLVGCHEAPAPAPAPAEAPKPPAVVKPAAPALREPDGTGPGIPRAAAPYRRDLVAASRAHWGLAAPVATFAAQIHQESAWNLRAQSPYANGLAQFTPATASWMGQIAPELGEPDVWNPAWAMRAMVRYDRWLWERVESDHECDRMALALSGYNGGLGWTKRDVRLAGASGADPRRWFGHVEKFNAGRAEWAFKENRGYPRNILLRWEPIYETSGWGGGSCDD
jgi:soluble lytic murein transglycosylase-like protein